MSVTFLTNEDKNELEQGLAEKVSFSSQTLTDEQKEQARANIGAADADYFAVTAEHSANLFDKTQPRESGFTLGTNAVVAVKDYETAVMPVELGKTYTFPIYYGMVGSGTAYFVGCYDSDLNYLGRITGTPNADNTLVTFTVGNTVVDNTTGATKEVNIAFVKFSVSVHAYGNPNADTFMFVEGIEYPSEYIPYELVESVSLNPKVKIPNLPETDSSPLHGKTVVFAGDSICNASTDETGVRGWAQRIGEKHSMNWQNNGISGATITSGVTGSSGCIADTDFGDSPDYIILEGGTNDADLIATADNFTPEAYGSFTLGQYNAEFDKTTFCGAVEHLFQRVTTDYAGAKIGFIIAHKMGYATTAAHYDAETSKRRKYFETIIELCKKWGIPYIDLWDGCYLNPMNPAHNDGTDPFYYNNDRQHLTAKGYDYITPMIEKWMESL